MKKKIFITRQIPERAHILFKEKGYEVFVSEKDGVLTKDELIAHLKEGTYDAVLCLLTDHIDNDVFSAAGPQCKIFANYAVGFDNIDLKSAKQHAITITNTPGVLSETVAEHTFGLILAIAHRIAEADVYTKSGLFKGWGPMVMLGSDVSGKTLGIIGLGRIGSRVAHHATKGFNMNIIYYDPKNNDAIEKEYGARRVELDALLQEADIVSIHIPLLPSTDHLIGERQLNMMKPSAYLVNTSRGPIIDEKALVTALQEKRIKGAAIDVFEHEPALTPGLADLHNVICTPHNASATEETRQKMAEIAAINIIAVLEEMVPPNKVV